MILAVLGWWGLSSLFGLLVLPIVWRLFHRLTVRGFGFARAFGLMAASYVLWLGAHFGLLRNSIGGATFALIILTVISGWVGRGRWHQLTDWVRSNRRMILTMEVLFLLSFLFWIVVRASMPALDHTEKPMELAFLNAIQRSETFPPLDPWLSGYAISYYYFGYVQLSMLTMLTGVVGSVGFNIANALWFAMSILGAYSILYNLLSRRDGKPRLGLSFLGPVFVFITGNLEGFLEVLHARGWFWAQNAQGEWVSPFWRWLDIDQLVNAPNLDPSWVPERFWWWWRASRVVRDVNLVGRRWEVIDEFPFFSFLLADNHPHLLALPIVLMAVAFAYQIFVSGKSETFRLHEGKPPWKALSAVQIGAVLFVMYLITRSAVTALNMDQGYGAVLLAIAKTGLLGALGYFLFWNLLQIMVGAASSALDTSEFWFGAWIFGGVIFLNTWDSPIYLTLFALCVWWRLRSMPLRVSFMSTLKTVAALGTMAILLYLPWYPTFASQLGGILPNLIYPTRFPQFLVMFATALVPITWWLLSKVRKLLTSDDTPLLLGLAFGLPLLLLLGSWAYALGIVRPAMSPDEFALGMSSFGADTMEDVYRASLSRLWTGWTALGLGFLFAMSAVLLLRNRGAPEGERTKNPTWLFVAMLILIGALLIIGPEYLYLRDQFGNRMNTIFKFYFTAWVLWGLAAAYAVSELWCWNWGTILGLCVLIPLFPIMVDIQDQLKATVLDGSTGTITPWILGLYLLAWLVWVVYAGKDVLFSKPIELLRRTLTVLVFVPLIMGLFYPFLTLWTKTDHFNPPLGWTLDGAVFIEQRYPGDYAAIQWIRVNITGGVISEAVGGSYNSSFARISTHTGLPTVLGWPGHERQWRGGSEEVGSREGDIATLYTTRNWAETLRILDMYDIDYVYIGPAERSQYENLIEEKFAAYMELIYQNEDVRIYARPGEAVP